MIFLDNASTTKVKNKVKIEVNKYLNSNYANPLAIYEYANEPAEAIKRSRNSISEILKCNPEEIIFTSGGSEANSLAIKGTAFSFYKENKKPIHIITTPIEHHSVLNACSQLVDLGIAAVSYLPVDKQGKVSLEDLEKSVTENTKLISIDWVNNEIGTVQPIEILADFANKRGILFHTDAVQAYGKIPLNCNNIALLTASGHKWGSPKGIGFLMAKKGVKLLPIINGGNQEKGLRGGTHNVPYIAGMGVASQIANINRKNNYDHEATFKFTLWDKLIKKLPLLKINGHLVSNCVPNIMNLNFYGYRVRGEQLLAFLSENGIFVSTGSACATGEPSHVLKEIGLSDEEIDCSLRLSFNENNSLSDIDKIVQVIADGVSLLGGG